MCVHFYVCEGSPFPLVSVSRFLLQDFLTIVSRDFMALMTPQGKTVPVVRQGTLAYLTPTIIPFAQATVPTSEIEICSLLDDIDLSGLASNLRGISDVIGGSCPVATVIICPGLLNSLLPQRIEISSVVLRDEGRVTTMCASLPIYPSKLLKVASLETKFRSLSSLGRIVLCLKKCRPLLAPPRLLRERLAQDVRLRR